MSKFFANLAEFLAESDMRDMYSGPGELGDG